MSPKFKILSRFTISRNKIIIIALAAMVLTTVSVAWARSGGSFRGGGFRSSSSSSSSSSRSFGSSSSSRSFGSSSPSSSYRPTPSYGGTHFVPVPVSGSTYYFGAPRPYRSYTSYHSYGSGGSLFGSIMALLVVGVIFFVIVWIIIAVVRARRRSVENQGGGDVGWVGNEHCDVWLMQFGVQMQAREIQDTLEAMASKIDPDSEDSLSYALRTMAQHLQDKLEFIEYAAVRGTEKMPMAKAEDQFQLWSGNERAKFNREIVRADSGGVRHQQKEMKTDGIRDEDGQLAVAEFFVVSVVLAVRGMAFVRQIHNSSELVTNLEKMGTVTGGQLVALEVVWSPAARSDAMGREDMEGRYPELAPV